MPSNIKNLILDFGGVIIDVDYNRTINAFKTLGLKNFDELFNQASQSRLFDLFDTGECSSDEFFGRLEKYLSPAVSRQQVVSAWNAMLGGFPKENYELLLKLKTHYRTFLLSNTNETHLDYYFSKLKEWYGISNMDGFFEETYYSHQIHLRKPETEIFEYVIDENRLNPRETLFVDDSLQHVKGARKAGLHAIHLKPPSRLRDIFDKFPI